MVTDAVESNERSAAGNGGVFSLAGGLAIGCALAGLLEFTRTFGAFENLQFIPTEAAEGSFVSWTWAMLAAPVAVVASAVLLAMAVGIVRTRFILGGAVLGLVATLWLAIRVWENVAGYLIVSDQGPPFETTPLPPQQWPFVYRHGIAIVICGVLVAFAAVVYAVWRIRPRAIAFAVGVLLALGIVFAGGQFGFAAMSFLRLRNLSVVVALIDVVIVALIIQRRRFDAILFLAVLILIASAWRLDRSWRAMSIEMPHGIEMPAW